MHVNDLLESIKEAGEISARMAGKNEHGVSRDLAAAHLHAGIERQLIAARDAFLAGLACALTDNGFIRNAIIGYRVPILIDGRWIDGA
jgi:hypothetical protein